MNIAESFVEYLESNGIATFGQDLYIGLAPSSDKVPDSIWWIIASGGSKTTSLRSGEAVKNYRLDIYYRNRDYDTVYNQLHSLEEQLNCEGCVQLNGFVTFNIEATLFPIDNDLDGEDRKIGLLQATITTYKEC